MSEYERTKGVLKEIKTDDIEEKAKYILQSEFGCNLADKPVYSHTYTEWLTDDYDKRYTIINDKLYEILSYENDWDAEPEFCDITVLSNGLIAFHTMYYNGGTYWQEVVGDELAKIVKQ